MALPLVINLQVDDLDGIAAQAAAGRTTPASGLVFDPPAPSTERLGEEGGDGQA